MSNVISGEAGPGPGIQAWGNTGPGVSTSSIASNFGTTIIWRFLSSIFYFIILFIYDEVVLRWGIQRGCAVVPKSENKQRIRENISVDQFHLSEEDMEVMRSLECGFRMNDPGYFCPKFFNTPCPIWD